MFQSRLPAHIGWLESQDSGLGRPNPDLLAGEQRIDDSPTFGVQALIEATMFFFPVSGASPNRIS